MTNDIAAYVGMSPLANPGGAVASAGRSLSTVALAGLRAWALSAPPPSSPQQREAWRRTAEFNVAGAAISSYWWRRVDISSPAHHPLAVELASIAFEVNQSTFRFDLSGISPDDPPRLLRLGPMDRRTERPDLTAEASRRKLTFVSFIDGPPGTGSALDGVPPAVTSRLAPGDTVFLPSWRRFGIQPSGIGDSTWLIGWVDGRPFR